MLLVCVISHKLNWKAVISNYFYQWPGKRIVQVSLQSVLTPLSLDKLTKLRKCGNWYHVNSFSEKKRGWRESEILFNFIKQAFEDQSLHSKCFSSGNYKGFFKSQCHFRLTFNSLQCPSVNFAFVCFHGHDVFKNGITFLVEVPENIAFFVVKIITINKLASMCSEIHLRRVCWFIE